MSDARPGLATPYRTHTCGELRASDAGTDARLAGWVHRRRDHGQLIFLDLRDRHGITQVVIDKTASPAAHETASRVRSEFVVTTSGEVAPRLPGTENPRMPTGEIELRADDIEILSEAKTPPFYINEPDKPVDEGLRLKYRYLDIRRQPMADRLLLRSRMVQAIREAHHAAGFVEVETPTLIKSTPEGARDFIVPSRLQPGSVYALPQSPQQLKQLLMVAGIDRYFQIARCYRDEDLRGDRQPEFTQLDLEMSFIDEDAVMAFIESMVVDVSRATTPDRPIAQMPFPRFTYDEVMERFGSDKPDVRFGMELVDLAPVIGDGSGFRVFDEALATDGRVKAIVATGLGGASRRELDELTDTAKRFGAKGLVHLSVEAVGLSGAAAKFLSDDLQRALVEATGAAEGDLILVVADRGDIVAEVLGRLRAELGAAWPTRPSSRTPGSTGSRCTRGTTRRGVGTPRTTRSAASFRRTRRSWSPPPGIPGVPHPTIPPVAPAPCSTTSCSTGGSSVGARSASTAAICSNAASSCRGRRSRGCGTSSERCSTPSSTERRRTAASRWGSTAGPPSWRARPTSAR
jgi:aspartyl-tRNA synthetase